MPVITANVSREIPNTFVTPSLVMWGASVPLFVIPSGASVISTARYGRGRVGVFGAERMVTGCCTSGSTNQSASDPALDRLLFNSAVWAAWYGYKVNGTTIL